MKGANTTQEALSRHAVDLCHIILISQWIQIFLPLCLRCY